MFHCMSTESGTTYLEHNKTYTSLTLHHQSISFNSQTRVVRRYEGKISEHISSILGDVLPVQGSVEVDETSLEYNFIGNDGNHSMFVLGWHPKAQFQYEGVGGAGFLFFQTRDGFKFKSIDTMFGKGSVVRKFILNNTGQAVEGKRCQHSKLYY